MEKSKSFTSPFGIALYPWLSKADVRYKPEGEFKVDLEISTTDAQGMITQINSFMDKAVKEAEEKLNKKGIKKSSHVPYKTEQGKTVFKFKMKASGKNQKTGDSFKQRPALFDNECNPINPDTTIWGGSVVRINYIPHTYYTPALGAGVTLRLKAVQVKDLVEGGKADAKFDKVDGNSSSKNTKTNDIEEELASEADF